MIHIAVHPEDQETEQVFFFFCVGLPLFYFRGKYLSLCKKVKRSAPPAKSTCQACVFKLFKLGKL